jgi:uncharacterized membrane protein
VTARGQWFSKETRKQSLKAVYKLKALGRAYFGTQMLKLWTIIFCLLISVTSATSDELSVFEGEWTPVTGAQIGSPVWFKKALIGYDAIIPWWGQTAINASGGDYGSHVKIAGSKDGKNIECFYYVSLVNASRMAWNLRHGDAGTCPDSVVFEKVQPAEEKKPEQAEEKKPEPAEEKKAEQAVDEKKDRVAEPFSLNVCNNQIYTQLNIALYYYLDSAQERIVQGWWNIQPKKCKVFIKLPRRPIYIYTAEQVGGEKSTWVGKHFVTDGSEVQLCVPHEAFKRVDTDGYKCNKDEHLVNFSRYEVMGSVTSVFLTRQAISAGIEPASRTAAEVHIQSAASRAAARSACPLKPGPIFPGGGGKVAGFLSVQKAQALLHSTEAQLHAKINPKYVNNPRAILSSNGQSVIAIVPASMSVKVGDQVEYSGGYTDPSLPCHYVPNLISGILHQAASGDSSY